MVILTMQKLFSEKEEFNVLLQQRQARFRQFHIDETMTTSIDDYMTTTLPQSPRIECYVLENNETKTGASLTL